MLPGPVIQEDEQQAALFSAQEQPRILIVEDEPDLCNVVASALSQSGFLVEEAASLGAAWEAMRDFKPHIIILDLGLPDGDGLSATPEIRRRTNCGIIVLTGRSDPLDKIVGLESGADDYLSKPIELRELVAHARALYRRLCDTGNVPKSGRVASFNGWQFDPDLQELRHGDHNHQRLTSFEARLLKALLDNPREALPRDQLLQMVGRRDGHSFDRSVDNLVSRLRSKFRDDPETADLFKSVRGIGYRFAGKVEWSS